MTTVGDASVVVDWVAPDVSPDAPAVAVLHRLAQQDEPLAAPRLLLHEVANALLTGIRRGRWSGAGAEVAHRHLQRLPTRVLDEDEDENAPSSWRVGMTSIRSTTWSPSRSRSGRRPR